MLPAGKLDEVELLVDGRNYRPKHVELIEIINKPLLLHLVGCLYYCTWTYSHITGTPEPASDFPFYNSKSFVNKWQKENTN